MGGKERDIQRNIIKNIKKKGKKSERGKQERQRKDGGQFRGFGRATKGKRRRRQWPVTGYNARGDSSAGERNFCIMCRIFGLICFCGRE